MSNTELLIREVETLPLNYVDIVLELIKGIKREAMGNSQVKDPRTIAEAIAMAEAKASNPNRKPYVPSGILRNTYGDALEYQRSLRDEWEDPWETSGAAHA